MSFSVFRILPRLSFAARSYWPHFVFLQLLHEAPSALKWQTTDEGKKEAAKRKRAAKKGEAAAEKQTSGARGDLKMAPRRPQDGPKMAPRWAKIAQDRPKIGEDGSRSPKVGGKMEEDGSKIADRAKKL